MPCVTSAPNEPCFHAKAFQTHLTGPPRRKRRGPWRPWRPRVQASHPPPCIGRPRGLFSDIQPISRRQGDIRGIRRRQRLPGWRNGGTQPAGSPGKEAAKGGSPWARRGARAPGAARRAPRASGGGHPLPSADFLSPVFTAHARRLGSQQTQKDARDSGSASPRRRKARRASRSRPPLFSSRVYLRILVLVTPVVKHFTSFCGKRRDASSSTLTIFLIHHAHSPSPPKIHLKGNSLPVR